MIHKNLQLLDTLHIAQLTTSKAIQHNHYKTILTHIRFLKSLNLFLIPNSPHLSASKHLSTDVFSCFQLKEMLNRYAIITLYLLHVKYPILCALCVLYVFVRFFYYIFNANLSVY